MDTTSSAFLIEPIATIHNGYNSKFGIPRQSGRASEALSTIVFEKPYRVQEALRGMEAYSHLWLIWQFSACPQGAFRPTVRPPRLGGNTRVGVFATRSPFRPNRLGLSSVRLESIEKTKHEGMVLIVSGADLMDGTPIFDIKPYISYTDSHPDAVCGFAEAQSGYRLTVYCPEELLRPLAPRTRATLLQMLENDPRPAYQHDETRVYAFEFEGHAVRFSVDGKTLTVHTIV